MNKEFITLNAITKEYESRYSSVRALNKVSFSLPERGLFFVVGKSGSGKSTLLNIIGGIDTPTDGILAIDGRLIDYSDESQLNAYRSESVGFVFQDFHLIEGFSVRDNVRLPLISNGLEVDEDEIDRLLRLVDLYDLQDKKPSCLSGGERQRTAIIRALAKKPKILLADEPTGNLDTEASRRVFEILKELSAQMPVIVVTHDVDSAYELADKIIRLDKGEVAQDLERTAKFDLEELKRSYRDRLQCMYEKAEQPSVTVHPIKDKGAKNKSAIPIKTAFFIAGAQIRARIVNTVLIVIILSLALMGCGLVYTTANFDASESLARVMAEKGHASIAISKGKVTDINTVDYYNDTFTYREYLDYAKKYGEVYKVYPYYYSFEPYVYDYDYTDREDVEKGRDHDLFQILGLCELSSAIGEEELQYFFGSKLIEGRYPQKRDNVIEILLSDALVDSFLQYGVVFDDSTVYPSSTFESVLGRRIKFMDIDFEIVGVYQSIYSESYVDGAEESEKERVFANQFISSIAITNKGAVENQMKDKSAFYGSLNLLDDDMSVVEELSAIFLSVGTTKKAIDMAEENEVELVFAEGYEKNSISNGEVILSYQLYCRIFNQYRYNDLGEKVNSFADVTPQSLKGLSFSVSLGSDETREYTVVGVFSDVDDYGGIVVMNGRGYEDTVNYFFTMASLIIPADVNNAADMIRENNNQQTVILAPENNEMLQAGKWFSILKSTLVLSIVIIIVFIMLMMYLLIAKNMGEGKKVIGVLRTFGVTRRDLAIIYLLIDLLYIFGAFVLGAILYISGCGVVNYLMGSAMKIKITLLLVNPHAILLMLAVAVASVLISSALPIIKYTRISPDQVIRRKE